MKPEAVRHTGSYPDIYLTDRRTLVVTLRTAKKDVDACRIHYFARTSPEKEKTQLTGERENTDIAVSVPGQPV